MDNYYDYYEEDQFGERKKNNKKKQNNKQNIYEEQYLNAKDEYGTIDETMGKLIYFKILFLNKIIVFFYLFTLVGKVTK